MHSEHEDAGVWPAYVAAVAGLVQSLLFVTAIMALTLLQVGMLAGRKADEALARAMSEATTPKSAPPSPRRPEMLQAVPTDGLNVRFAHDALWLDDAARERLKAELRRQLAQGMRQWQVSVETNVDDPLLRRAAYLRLMATRAVFIEVGIEPWRLQVRLLSARAEAVQTGLQVRIVPSREEPATQPGAAEPAGAGASEH